MSHLRYTRNNPCPVCTSGTKNCSRTPDGFHLCRGPSAQPGYVCLVDKGTGWRGYRHEDDDNRTGRGHWRSLPGTLVPAKPAKFVIDWNQAVSNRVRSLTSERVAELAQRLGVPASVFSLTPLLGYYRGPTYLIDGESFHERYWTCPETDADGQVIGIERRYPREDIPTGETDKRSWPGGSRGLNLPRGWRDRPGPAFNVEGFSCVVAATAAGLCATSRPGSRAGIDHLVDLYRDWPRDRDIIIVGENDQKENGDWPGREGAIAIATQLAERISRPVKWALPPTGVKDVRDYLKDGSGWGATAWIERGAELVAHFLRTAETVGADQLSITAFTASIAGEPEPCPFAASRDMRDELNLSTRKCPNQSPVRFEKKGICFVCNRDCGNGTACRPCLEKRLYKLLKMSDSYLIRTSVEMGLSESGSTDKPRVVYAAIKHSGPTESLKKAIKRRDGERVSILTEDAETIAVLLAGENDVSRFFLEAMKEDNGEIGTVNTLSLPTHLWVVSLPADSEPPDGFHRVTVAAAIRALHHAVKTVPLAPEGTTRYKPTHKSAGWGDEEEKVPTDTKCLGPSAFKPAEVRDILTGASVPVVRVQFDGKRSRAFGIGWSLPALPSAALNLWIGGTASPGQPTVERVIELANDWLPKLAVMPREIGQGPNVQRVLRENLWYLSLYDIDQQVKEADEQDKAEEAFVTEARSILRSLREQYRGREHEAKGVVAFLLA